MTDSTVPSAPAELPTLSEEAVQVRMMRELFVRTRESVLLGFLPIFLILWSHWHAQPRSQLLLWLACALALLGYRLLVAHLFLARPQEQPARQRLWFWLEWVGCIGLAATWVSSIAVLGSGETDALFYLRLIFIVALVAFVLSALGIEIRLYASFMATTVGGTLLLLHLYYPGYVQALPMVNAAFVVYALMLLVRSRGEHRRTREWVRARLSQRLLLDQLNQTIRKELLMHEALRIKGMELESTNRKLGELATRDGLTGAYRRGHIEAELRRLVKGLQRKPGDFSIQLLDLDFFKRVNDVHGQAVGDEVLQRTAVQVQDAVRSSDLFGRWNGGKFIVLLSDTALPQALEAAERLRLAIEHMEFTGLAGAAFRVTASIGVAQFEPELTADELAQHADHALSAAKRGGRNRVLAYEAGQSQLSMLH